MRLHSHHLRSISHRLLLPTKQPFCSGFHVWNGKSTLTKGWCARGIGHGHLFGLLNRWERHREGRAGSGVRGSNEQRVREFRE